MTENLLSKLIRFQRKAVALKRDSHSIRELKLWLQAENEAEFEKILQENPDLLDKDIDDILNILRPYKLSREQIVDFFHQHILKVVPDRRDKDRMTDEEFEKQRDKKEYPRNKNKKPKDEKDADISLDRTDGRPGGSYGEVLENLSSMG